MSRPRYRLRSARHPPSVGKKLELVLDEPSWAVVEKFDGSVPEELLHRAPLRALRSLGCGAASLVDLAKRKLVFPSLEDLSTTEDFHDGESLQALFPVLRTLRISSRHGPTVADVARALRVRVHRLVFERWVESEERGSAIPFDALLEGVLSLEATVPEIALLPPFHDWPQPSLVELRAVAGRYEKLETSEPAPPR